MNNLSHRMRYLEVIEGLRCSALRKDTPSKLRARLFEILRILEKEKSAAEKSRNFKPVLLVMEAQEKKLLEEIERLVSITEVILAKEKILAALHAAEERPNAEIEKRALREGISEILFERYDLPRHWTAPECCLGCGGPVEIESAEIKNGYEYRECVRCRKCGKRMVRITKI